MTYVCPLCRRKFATQHALKEHLHKFLRRNPTCIVCGKRFRATQQLCAHAYTKVKRCGDAMHAVVYYLARKRRNRGRVNSVMRLGEKLAGEMLTGKPFLLTPPPDGEWQGTMWQLAQRYYNGASLKELACEAGVHPDELRRMFGEVGLATSTSQ